MQRSLSLTTAFSSLCLRRGCRAYATIPNNSAPPASTAVSSTEPAPSSADNDGNANAKQFTPPADTTPSALAQAASAPLKVQERRTKLTKDFALTRPSERTQSRAEKRQAVRPAVSPGGLRSRLRGVRLVRHGKNSVSEQIVGQRVYLPNIVFTMMPNQTRAGEAYNPYEATFRIPHNITKTDVRAYLGAVYGVGCTYIRTDNRFTAQKYLKNVASGRQMKANHRHGYKRAVVGLEEPFYFPQMLEDMDGKTRWLREAQLEDDFRLKETKEMIRNKQTKWTAKKKPEKIQFSRGKLIKTLWERRLERERSKREFVEALGARGKAQTGTQVTES